MDHCQGVGTLLQEAATVLRINAADGDQWNGQPLASLLEDSGIRRRGLWLGARGEEAAEGHVVGAGFSGLLGQSQVAMTGNADNFAGPESLSRAGNAAVTLADMDTVGLNVCGQGRVVVDLLV